MHNAAAEGRLTLGAIWFEMNPLAIFGGVGEFLDAILCDDEPVRRWKFASFELFQRIQIFNFKRWHRSFS